MKSQHHITKSDIETAKNTCKYSDTPFHEHDDCIRIAYEWLSAQVPIRNARSRVIPLKHVIEHWAGRYVSKSDVEVAVHLHPNFWGVYPFYNFGKHIVEPDTKRLQHIAEAFTQMNYREKHDAGLYQIKE